MLIVGPIGLVKI